MSLSALRHPITLRHGSQDPNAIIDTVVRREYGRGWEGETPTTMIDAGAYIGDTSAYFLSRFPALQVVALEPDPSNLELAKLNLSPFGARVAVRHNALNGVRGTVHLAGAELGAHISADGIGEAVEAVTVPDVMAEKGWDRLDLLKMDIEGAEAAVLSDSADAWLHRVQRVVLEPHGAAVEAAVRHRLTRNGFQIEGFGSLLYATRPR